MKMPQQTDDIQLINDVNELRDSQSNCPTFQEHLKIAKEIDLIMIK